MVRVTWQDTFLGWAVAIGVAELAGIALAGMWWVSVDRWLGDPVAGAAIALVLCAKAAAGLFEGALLGFVEGRLLQRMFPKLSLGRFMVATAGVAVAGWAIGSAIPLFLGVEAASSGETLAEPPLAQVLLFAALFGVLAGALFGAAQAFVLARAAHKVWWWIAANAAGWMVALPAIYLAASQGDPEAALWNAIAYGVAGGLVAGLLVGSAAWCGARLMQPA